MSMKAAIGIDLGGTRIKAALVDSNGKISNEIIDPTDTAYGYSSVLSQLAEIVEMLREYVSDSLIGIGLGVAGLMDRGNRRVIVSPNVGMLSGRAISTDLEERTGIPVFMDNDANCMALGEGFCGAARGCNHYIAVTLGTGIGGAIVSDGNLIRGFAGGGGEVGHIPISSDGPVCGCGARGCLEAYVGQAGIRNYVERQYPDLNETSIKALNRMAVDGNEDAIAVFAYIGKTLGIGLTGLVNVFNPELVIIGGGIAAAGDLVFKPMESELKERAFETYTKDMAVRPAELGNWAGVVGAGMLALG